MPSKRIDVSVSLLCLSTPTAWTREPKGFFRRHETLNEQLVREAGLGSMQQGARSRPTRFGGHERTS
jgi:hypothetical protein